MLQSATSPTWQYLIQLSPLLTEAAEIRFVTLCWKGSTFPIILRKKSFEINCSRHESFKSCACSVQHS